MEQSIFVAMCQVNIAVGFVYIGLREFRYRDILKDKAWSAFGSSGCDNISYDEIKFTELMTDDSEFSKSYHYVMKCASMYLIDRLPEQLAASLNRRSDGRNPFSTLFSWYNTIADKIVVFVITIILPIIWLWTESKPAWALAAGQILIVVQVSAVWIVATTVAIRIRKRGTYVVTSLDRKDADDQVEAIRPAQQ